MSISDLCSALLIFFRRENEIPSGGVRITETQLTARNTVLTKYCRLLNYFQWKSLFEITALLKDIRKRVKFDDNPRGNQGCVQLELKWFLFGLLHESTSVEPSLVSTIGKHDVIHGANHRGTRQAGSYHAHRTSRSPSKGRSMLKVYCNASRITY